MSPDKQQIAIAEACGIISKDQWGPLYKTPQGILRDCPDYLTDLNAMHEAEKVMTAGEREQFKDILEVVCARTFQWDRISATAAQRAEAFLRTVGKWEDAK